MTVNIQPADETILIALGGVIALYVIVLLMRVLGDGKIEKDDDE